MRILVTGMSPPAQHVQEAWSSAEFYGNRILREARESPGQAEWVKQLKACTTALQSFVAEHYPGGPKWQPAGKSKPEPTPSQASQPAGELSC